MHMLLRVFGRVHHPTGVAQLLYHYALLFKRCSSDLEPLIQLCRQPCFICFEHDLVLWPNYMEVIVRQRQLLWIRLIQGNGTTHTLAVDVACFLPVWWSLPSLCRTRLTATPLGPKLLGYLWQRSMRPNASFWT